MTKADVIREISEKTGLDKAAVSSIVETFFTLVKDQLSQGENIYVRGFGSFLTKKRARKTARLISSNTALVIEAHYIPFFKPAPDFVERIRKKLAAE